MLTGYRMFAVYLICTIFWVVPDVRWLIQIYFEHKEFILSL